MTLVLRQHRAQLGAELETGRVKRKTEFNNSQEFGNRLVALPASKKRVFIIESRPRPSQTAIPWPVAVTKISATKQSVATDGFGRRGHAVPVT